MRRHNKLTIIIYVVLSLVPFATYGSSLKLKEPGVLSVLAYSEFRPVSYGNGMGYEGDLIRAAAKLLHVKVKFYPEKIYEGIWRAPSRDYVKVDIAMGGITPLSSRSREGAVFSTATARYPQSLLIRKKDYESGRIRSFSSFRNTNLKIGVVAGTTGEYFARQESKKSGLSPNSIVIYQSENELIPALLSGKIAAIARGTIGNDYQASLHPTLLTIDRKDYHDQFAYAIDQSNPELQEKLNRIISYLTDNGKIGYNEWASNPHVFEKRAKQLYTLNRIISYLTDNGKWPI